MCWLDLGQNGQKTAGYEQLNWLTIQQTSIESSLRLFFKVLWTKRPQNLYDMIYDSDNDRVLSLSDIDIHPLTKLSRKTWRIKVLRYSSLVPPKLYEIDPSSQCFKTILKEWIKHNIPRDGDRIFRGKVAHDVIQDTEANVAKDWLILEVEDWRKMESHNYQSLLEIEEIFDAG